MAALTFLRQNRLHLEFVEDQALALEEIVVSTAEGKTTKEQIGSFFRSCYTGPELLEDCQSSL